MNKTGKWQRAKRALLVFAALLLCAALLAGCGAGAGGSGSAPGSGPDEPSGGETGGLLCRIVDGAAEGELLLAAQRSEGDALYRLTVGDTAVLLDGQPADAGQLRDGMLLTVEYTGSVLETYPAMMEGVTALHAVTAGQDDRCGLVLQAFEDLWAEDSGLNGEIAYMGFEIGETLVPEASERQGIAWRFAELHGAQPLTGSWQQLADEGYIDAKNLYWEDGLFFSFTPTENKDQKEDQLFFTAQKWRSGLGALFFVDCTARRDASGGWQYEAGGFAIA